jgi:putative transposase
LIETPDANLSKGMRQLNGVYTRRFNASLGRCGHVFQGRHTASIVQKAAYLKELARYIVLNPVRARMVDRPQDWPWSGCAATTGAPLGLHYARISRIVRAAEEAKGKT